MKIRHIIGTIGLLVVGLTANAKEVDYTTAEKVAMQFHSLLYQADGTTHNVTCELVYANEPKTRSSQSLFYIFNYDKGFVIVSGNDIVSPVLAYSTTHKLVSENPSCNVRYILNYYERQMTSMLNVEADAHPHWNDLAAVLATTTDGASDDLLYDTAKWSQFAPYNKFCPTVNGKECATGCVATAFSIAMKQRR